MNKSKSMNAKVVFNVRDARGLTTLEKVFLFVVASRGVAKTSRLRLMEDTGMSTGSLTNVVRSLTDKELINVSLSSYDPVTGQKGQTFYTIHEQHLEDWCSRDELPSSGDESGSSGDELGSSPHELGSSGDGVKGDIEEDKKDTEKETVKTEAVADAPAVPLLSIKEDEEPEEKVDSMKSIPEPLLAKYWAGTVPSREELNRFRELTSTGKWGRKSPLQACLQIEMEKEAETW